MPWSNVDAPITWRQALVLWWCWFLIDGKIAVGFWQGLGVLPMPGN